MWLRTSRISATTVAAPSSQREPAPVRDRVDPDDRSDAAGMERRDREQADRTEADDDRGVAGMEARALDAVDRHRQRLDEAGVLQAQPGGSAWRSAAGTATSSAKPPSRANPIPAVSAIAQRYDAPPRQSSQPPQGILGSMTTSSPAAQPVTPSPTASMAPASSWPGTVSVNRPTLYERQVRAADPASVDPDDDLAGHRLGLGDVDELETVRLEEPDRSHAYISPSWATMRSSSEMTAGSVCTSMTLQTPLSIARSSAGRRLLEPLDALSVAAQRLRETVVADPGERAGDVASRPEELVLLVADVTPAGVVRHDHDHGQLVAHRGRHLHGAQAEGAVAGEEEDPLIGSRRLRREGERHPDAERSECRRGGEQPAGQLGAEIRERPGERIATVGDARCTAAEPVVHQDRGQRAPLRRRASAPRVLVDLSIPEVRATPRRANAHGPATPPRRAASPPRRRSSPAPPTRCRRSP